MKSPSAIKFRIELAPDTDRADALVDYVFIVEDPSMLRKAEAIAQVFAKQYEGQVVFRPGEPLMVRTRLKSSISLAAKIFEDFIKAKSGGNPFDEQQNNPDPVTA